jgi:hypothetical protein
MLDTDAWQAPSLTRFSRCMGQDMVSYGEWDKNVPGEDGGTTLNWLLGDLQPLADGRLGAGEQALDVFVVTVPDAYRR